MSDDERPVEVILLGMGMGMDVDATSIERMAAASGDRYVPVVKPEDMPEVLVGLIAARTGG